MVKYGQVLSRVVKGCQVLSGIVIERKLQLTIPDYT